MLKKSLTPFAIKNIHLQQFPELAIIFIATRKLRVFGQTIDKNIY